MRSHAKERAENMGRTGNSDNNVLMKGRDVRIPACVEGFKEGTRESNVPPRIRLGVPQYFGNLSVFSVKCGTCEGNCCMLGKGERLRVAGT